MGDQEKSSGNATTSTGYMKELETLLCCGICLELMTTAMMLSKCSHNFCSLCIRRYINYKQQCPTCRESAVDTDLRNNRQLDDIISLVKNSKSKTSVSKNIESVGCEKLISETKLHNTSFTASTKCQVSSVKELELVTKTEEKSAYNKAAYPPDILSDHLLLNTSKSIQDENILDLTLEDDFDATQFISPLKTGISSVNSKPSAVGSSQASDVNKLSRFFTKTQPRVVAIKPERGLSDVRASAGPTAECPVCRVDIPVNNMNAHLDLCLKGEEKKESLRSFSKRKPLPKLVYNLLSDKELKKRIAESGLPMHGDKKTLIERHREFTLRYNSECDSLNPKSAAVIIQEMLTEENDKQSRSNKPTLTTTASTSIKIDKGASADEIESAQKSYVKQHKSQFAELIAAARNRKQAGFSKPSSQSTVELESNSADKNKELEKESLQRNKEKVLSSAVDQEADPVPELRPIRSPVVSVPSSCYNKSSSEHDNCDDTQSCSDETQNIEVERALDPVKRPNVIGSSGILDEFCMDSNDSVGDRLRHFDPDSLGCDSDNSDVSNSSVSLLADGVAVQNVASKATSSEIENVKTVAESENDDNDTDYIDDDETDDDFCPNKKLNLSFGSKKSSRIRNKKDDEKISNTKSSVSSTFLESVDEKNSATTSNENLPSHQNNSAVLVSNDCNEKDSSENVSSDSKQSARGSSNIDSVSTAELLNETSNQSATELFSSNELNPKEIDEKIEEKVILSTSQSSLTSDTLLLSGVETGVNKTKEDEVKQDVEGLDDRGIKKSRNTRQRRSNKEENTAETAFTVSKEKESVRDSRQRRSVRQAGKRKYCDDYEYDVDDVDDDDDDVKSNSTRTKNKKNDESVTVESRTVGTKRARTTRK